MIFVIPKNIRRVHHIAPWRQFTLPPFLKAIDFLDNEFPQSKQAHLNFHENYRTMERVPFTKDVFHGGDDFDQGYEEVNNVIVPHGKDVNHALSFGEGYVPHEALQHHSGFSSPVSNHHAFDGSQISYFLPYLTQQLDPYFYNYEGFQHGYENQDWKADAAIAKFFLNRAPLKNFEKSILDALTRPGYRLETMMRRLFFIPRRIALETTSGNIQGIVFRDSIPLDESNKELLQLTKSWPSAVGSLPGSALSTKLKYGEYSIFKPPSRYLNRHVSFRPGEAHSDLVRSGWTTSPRDNRQHGYAVTEDTQAIHNDFSTVPVQTGPVVDQQFQ